MGLFSGSKRQSSTVESASAHAQGEVEAAQVLQGVNVSAGSALQLSDYGSIERAFDLAIESLGFAHSSGEREAAAYDDATNRVTAATSQVADAFKTSKELSGAVNAQQLMLAVLGAGVVAVGIFAFRK